MKKPEPSNIPSQCPRRSVDPVGHYAWNVLHNSVTTGHLVQLACRRHFDDLAKGRKRGIVYSPEWASYAISFFEQFLHHSKGEWAGEPLKLGGWQAFIIGSAFGWFRKNGTRRFRTIYLELGRKNGKSTILAGVGLFALVADQEPGSEVYSAATRRDQAAIIFDEAKRMVRASPVLSRLVSSYRRALSVDRTGSKFEPLSADDKTLDGLNPHCVLVDELHKHRSRAVLDVLDTAMGSRRSPMLWVITTAGDESPTTAYAQENAYAAQVMAGTVQDDTYLAYIATLDKNDAWDDRSVWIKANPNLHISVKLDDLERQAQKAQESPAALVAFKRLRLNVRTSDAYRAVDMEVWRRNSEGPFDPASLAGRRFYGAVDLSSKIDLSAWVMLFPPEGEETRFRVVCRFWMPSETVAAKSQRDKVQYRRWIEDGLIFVTEGNVIDHMEVQRTILEDCRIYSPLSIAYDPWNATQLAMSLHSQGLELAEFIQGIKSYSAPTKELEAMLLAQRLDHGDNEVLAWMASNLQIQFDKNENRMPSKKHSISRIDGMAALIMCLGRWLLDDQGASLDQFLDNPIL